MDTLKCSTEVFDRLSNEIRDAIDRVLPPSAEGEDDDLRGLIAFESARCARDMLGGSDR